MFRYPQIAGCFCKDMDNKMKTGVSWTEWCNYVLTVHFWPPVRKHGATENKLKKVSSDQTLDLILRIASLKKSL